MKIFRALVAAFLAARQANAKAVFAHFMLGNTGGYSVGEFVNDMQLAQQSAIDGFALNMANAESQSLNSIPLAFQAASQVSGFKLFFSFDYAGNGAWSASQVQSLIQTWSGHGSYFRHSTGQPLVSTFEGTGNAGDWHNIKSATNAFFVPDWSSQGAKNAVALSSGVADGLFNWGAWPDGTSTTSWDLDASYLIFLQQGGKPTYMASISPWFYTNMPGYNKNWLWQGGELWYQRWGQLAALSVLGQSQWPNEPEYIEIISWNDYGESHYIGPLNEKGYLPFGQGYGNAPLNYAAGHPHDGWRQMLPFMISMWKTGTAVISQEIVTAWYRLTPGNACNSGGTTGNSPQQGQTALSPQQVSPDKVFVAALLTKPGTARVTIGGNVINVQWDTVPPNSIGIHYGSIDTKGASGSIKVEIVDSSQGSVVGTLNGESIKASCPDSVVNWNAWVGSTTLSRSISPTSPKFNLKDLMCTKGDGSKSQFSQLCQFTCSYGYCPPGPCTCYAMGNNTLASQPTKNINGYPLPGADCTFSGLCAFACNHGFCPSNTCTTDSSASGQCASPAPGNGGGSGGGGGGGSGGGSGDIGCTSGTGTGNLQGLCDFSCGRGYCPEDACTCTGYGPKITPPAETDAPGVPASGLGDEYKGLCSFACAHGYCPSGACVRQSTSTGCISGTGTGNLAGLCSFCCGNGYCPAGSCTCTAYGPAITPPADTAAPGVPASGLGDEYKGLCSFACAHGYCPSGACVRT